MNTIKTRLTHRWDTAEVRSARECHEYREDIVGRMVELMSINGLHPELSPGGNVS